jgi:hypothetical protein
MHQCDWDTQFMTQIIKTIPSDPSRVKTHVRFSQFALFIPIQNINGSYGTALSNLNSKDTKLRLNNRHKMIFPTIEQHTKTY